MRGSGAAATSSLPRRAGEATKLSQAGRRITPEGTGVRRSGVSGAGRGVQESRSNRACATFLVKRGSGQERERLTDPWGVAETESREEHEREGVADEDRRDESEALGDPLTVPFAAPPILLVLLPFFARANTKPVRGQSHPARPLFYAIVSRIRVQNWAQAPPARVGRICQRVPFRFDPRRSGWHAGPSPPGGRAPVPTQPRPSGTSTRSWT